jgi:hypothetical protein
MSKSVQEEYKDALQKSNRNDGGDDGKETSASAASTSGAWGMK